MSESFFNKNYYELFNVSENASAMDIKRAYARLVRQYSNETHPEQFIHIQKAYQVLSNPSQRNEYDQRLNQGTTYSNENEQYTQSDSYNQNESYDNTYNYNEQQTYTNYDSYNNQQTYNEYNNDDYTSQQYETYQNQYENTRQSNYGQSTTYREERPRGQYSLLGNLIFSFILSIIFTPIVGIIGGIIIHVFKIPVMRILGCIFWFIIIIIVLSIILNFL